MQTIFTQSIEPTICQAIEANLLSYPEIAGAAYLEMSRGVVMGKAIQRASADNKSNLSRRERKYFQPKEGEFTAKLLPISEAINAGISAPRIAPLNPSELGLHGIYASAFQLRLAGLSHRAIGLALDISAKEAGRILSEIFSQIRQELS